MSISNFFSVFYLRLLVGSLALSALGVAQESSSAYAEQSLSQSVHELRQQVQELRATVVEMKSEAAEYRAQTEQLREEVEKLRKPPLSAVGTTAAIPSDQRAPASIEQRVSTLEENTQLQGSEIRTQYQTKIESASKYRVRLSGLVLMNLFRNSGFVDNQDFPGHFEVR